jgi:peptide chain release factor 1
MEYNRRKKEEKSTKKLQIGIAARSDKLRTYNFPQNRITDHRLNESIYDINDFMKGNGDKLFSLVTKLEQQRRQELIQQIKNALEINIT